MRVMLYTDESRRSCMLAKSYLQENNLPFIDFKLKSNSLSVENVLYIFSRTMDLVDIFDRHSSTYHAFGLNDCFEDYSVKELARLVSVYPSLLKQPIIMTERKMSIGFRPENYI